jgi:hypothetical protein
MPLLPSEHVSFSREGTIASVMMLSYWVLVDPFWLTCQVIAANVTCEHLHTSLPSSRSSLSSPLAAALPHCRAPEPWDLCIPPSSPWPVPPTSQLPFKSQWHPEEGNFPWLEPHGPRPTLLYAAVTTQPSVPSQPSALGMWVPGTSGLTLDQTFWIMCRPPSCDLLVGAGQVTSELELFLTRPLAEGLYDTAQVAYILYSPCQDHVEQLK